jgi:hypothetical protein
VIVGFHEPAAVLHQRLLARIVGIGNGNAGDAIGERACLEGTKEETLPGDHLAGIARVLEQIGRHERQVVRIARA